MRRATVFYKDQAAGTLSQLDDGSFEFAYLQIWLSDRSKPAISLTLPKKQEVYRSSFLFPFFYHLLPEGSNKQALCFQLRIDTTDNFSLLMICAETDSIGAVRVVKNEVI